MSRVTEVTLFVCDTCGCVATYDEHPEADCGHGMAPVRFIRASDEYTEPAPEPGCEISALADTIAEWLTVAPQTFDALVGRASMAGITNQPFDVIDAVGMVRARYYVEETDAGYIIGPRK